MSIFKIQIKPGTPAVFDPNPRMVAVNDSVYWYNGDKKAHWPAPSASNPTGFMKYQITPKGQSTQVSFGTVKTVNYICVNHPNEFGKICVVTPEKKKKGAFGCKTKKGAFGRKTKKGAFAGKTKY